MFEIGSSLREARERRGLSYADVELGTKVRSRYIKALEDERFDILPGPTYTKGFLRAYADYLGLDGNLYIDEFNSRHHDPRRDPESEIYPRSKARTQHRQRRESNIVLIALAAIVAVSSLVFLAWDNSHPSATLPIPPATSNTSNGGSSSNTSPSSTKTKTVKNQVPRRVHAHGGRERGRLLGVGAQVEGGRPGGRRHQRQQPGGPGREGWAERDDDGARSGVHLARLAQRGAYRRQRPLGARALHPCRRASEDHPQHHLGGVIRPQAAVLLTGSELLRGVIHDRNAPFLAAELERMGFEVRRTLIVGDAYEDVVGAVRELSAEVDLLVTSGGLGPTHDDRTVPAIAEAAGVELELDEAVLAKITKWTDGRVKWGGLDASRFVAGNRKQAMVPVTAEVIGLAGTAPGLVMPVGSAFAVILPGVPSELRRLWQDVPQMPSLRELFGRLRPRGRLFLRTYGIGESHVADLFEDAGGDSPGVETSICARDFEIEIDIRFEPDAAGAGGSPGGGHAGAAGRLPVRGGRAAGGGARAGAVSRPRVAAGDR